MPAAFILSRFETISSSAVRLRKTEDSQACAGFTRKPKRAFRRDPACASRDH